MKSVLGVREDPKRDEKVFDQLRLVFMIGREALEEVDFALLKLRLYRQKRIACAAKHGTFRRLHSPFDIRVPLGKQPLQFVSNELRLVLFVIALKDLHATRHGKLLMCHVT
ncbi:hypothetical protein D3C76_1234630 [compost metagenome]